MFTLDQILGLVGPLDDSSGANTPRERFRSFLRESVISVGSVRDYVESCLNNKGPQYDFALQDLVNHIGTLIGFDVTFGRYRGIANEIGHDGLWRRQGFSIVVEVKTTDAFSIRTDTLVGYVNQLISAQQVTDWDHALGLYVFARTDAHLKPLGNSIIAEKRTHELRIATVDTILSLAELVQEGHITPDEAVALLKPGGVMVSDTVRVIARIASQSASIEAIQTSSEPIAPVGVEVTEVPRTESLLPPSPGTGTSFRVSGQNADQLYLMTPVSDEEMQTAQQTISSLLNAGWYVFADGTAGLKRLKPSDRICFYESGVGVVADTKVASKPERKPPSDPRLVKNPTKFAWSLQVTEPKLYFQRAIVIDAALREQLDAFRGRDLARSWSWFVQGTRIITKHDFDILTGRDR
jgi:hypothetical protein